MIAFRMNPRWLMAASLLAAGMVVSAAFAATPEDSVSQAARSVEIARLRFKLYERVDYPLRMRQLQNEIKLQEACVDSLRRRVKETDRFRYAEGLFTTTEILRLELLRAELSLQNSQHELQLLERHNQDERRLHRLLIETAQRQTMMR